MLKQLLSLCLWAFVFSFAAIYRVQAADVERILIAKGVVLVQTNANAPGLAGSPYEFLCQASLSGPGVASAISVKPPAHAFTNLENLDWSFLLSSAWPVKSSVDSRFPAGTYAVSVQAAHDGSQNFQVALGGDAYPVNPQFLNWAALQEVHVGSETLLSWSPFTGGTAQDFVQVRIYNDFYEAFSTPEFGQPGALNGTNTWVSVPADTMFFPGETYTVELIFGNILAVNSGLYPGAQVITGYYKTTTTTLQTYNPNGMLEFSSANFNVYEYEGQGTVTVIRRGGTEGAVSVAYSTSDGSAIAGLDYQYTFGTLYFAPGEQTKTFHVTVFNDYSGDPTMTIQLGLSGFEGGATPGSTTSAALRILDDEAPMGPNVAFYLLAKGQNYLQNSTNSPVLDTNNAPFRFVAALEAAFSNSVSAASVLIPANVFKALVASIDRIQFDFGASFPTKAAVDAAYPSGNYKFNIGTKGEGTKTPLLNLPAESYPPAPRLANWIEAQEIEPAAAFTLSWDRMTGATTNDFINVVVRDAGGNDILGSPWLFEQGYLNGFATNWTIPANMLVPGQPYTARLLFVKRVGLNTTAYPGVPGVSAFYKETSASIAAAATPTPQGRLVFASTGFSVAENAGQAVITVNRVGGSSGQVTVDYLTYNGSALAAVDYASASGTLVFGDGETTKSFSVQINDDFLLDGSKSLFVGLSNPTGGAVIPNYPYATLAILDNENASAGTIQFANTNIVVAETAGKASVVLNRGGGSSGVVSVDLLVGFGTALPELDFVSPATTVTFNPGELTKTVLIPIINDALDEQNETFQLYLSNTTGAASLGPNRNASLTILDNDTGGTIQFSARTISVNETSPVVNLTVNRSGGTASGVTVNYTAFNGTAANELDFALAAGTLTFGSNELSKTISFQLLNDIEVEGNQAFTVSLSTPTGGAVLGAVSNIVVTIVDDESSIQFSSATYTNSEGLLSVKLSVQRLGPTATPASVDYFTMDGTASNLDYQSKSGHLSFTAGLASQTISLVLSNDTIVEGQQWFQVCLTNVVGALFGSRTNATVYINDNDLGGVIQFSATNYTVAENVANASIVVSRSGGAASAVTVDFTTLDGSAIDGQDYVNSTRTIAFNASETTKTVMIPIRNNSLVQSNKTVLLILSHPQGGATLGKNTGSILTIKDEDIGGTIQFSAATYTTPETNGFATLTVTRSGGLASGVSVDFSLQDVSAAAGINYVATNGTLTFGSNQTSLTLKIPVLHDNVDTTNKIARIILENVRGGATLGVQKTANILIQDNDIDIRGAYSGTGSFSRAWCQAMSLNTAYTGIASVSITEQSGFAFAGMLTIAHGAAPFVVALTGTVDGSGAIKGSYQDQEDTQAGRFTGTIIGKSLKISYNGAFRWDSCLDTGTITASR